MGACASSPKVKGEAGGAPPPEPPKEDTAAAPEVVEVKTVDKEVVEGGDNNAKAEDDKPESLGTLLNESEEGKETPAAEKPSEIQNTQPETVKAAAEEEQKPEEVAAYVAPVAHVTKETEIVVKEEQKE